VFIVSDDMIDEVSRTIGLPVLELTSGHLLFLQLLSGLGGGSCVLARYAAAEALRTLPVNVVLFENVMAGGCAETIGRPGAGIGRVGLTGGAAEAAAVIREFAGLPVPYLDSDAGPARAFGMLCETAFERMELAWEVGDAQLGQWLEQLFALVRRITESDPAAAFALSNLAILGMRFAEDAERDDGGQRTRLEAYGRVAEFEEVYGIMSLLERGVKQGKVRDAPLMALSEVVMCGEIHFLDFLHRVPWVVDGKDPRIELAGPAVLIEMLSSMRYQAVECGAEFRPLLSGFSSPSGSTIWLVRTKDGDLSDVVPHELFHEQTRWYWRVKFNPLAPTKLARLKAGTQLVHRRPCKGGILLDLAWGRVIIEVSIRGYGIASVMVQAQPEPGGVRAERF
jgi:hypothetical protein